MHFDLYNDVVLFLFHEKKPCNIDEDIVLILITFFEVYITCGTFYYKRKTQARVMNWALSYRWQHVAMDYRAHIHISRINLTHHIPTHAKIFSHLTSPCFASSRLAPPSPSSSHFVSFRLDSTHLTSSFPSFTFISSLLSSLYYISLHLT